MLDEISMNRLKLKIVNVKDHSKILFCSHKKQYFYGEIRMNVNGLNASTVGHSFNPNWAALRIKIDTFNCHRCEIKNWHWKNSHRLLQCIAFGQFEWKNLTRFAFEIIQIIRRVSRSAYNILQLKFNFSFPERTNEMYIYFFSISNFVCFPNTQTFVYLTGEWEKKKGKKERQPPLWMRKYKRERRKKTPNTHSCMCHTYTIHNSKL